MKSRVRADMAPPARRQRAPAPATVLPLPAVLCYDTLPVSLPPPLALLLCHRGEFSKELCGKPTSYELMRLRVKLMNSEIARKGPGITVPQD